MWVYFSVLYSSPWIFVSIPPPISNHPDYCSYKKALKSGKLISSILFFFFFFKIVLAVLGPLPFHRNFIITWSVSIKNLAEIFEKWFYLFMCEREIVYAHRERKKQTPHWAQSLMWGLIPGPWDHNMIRRQMLN